MPVHSSIVTIRRMVNIFCRCVLLLISGIAVLDSTWVLADDHRMVIKVGGYAFPPFVEEDKEGKVSGMTLDMMALINQSQDTYYLEFFHTSSKRRYIDFSENRYDMLFFESRRWGWQNYPVSESDVYMGGGEVYIAYKHVDRDQHYFDQLNQRHLVGLLGYHYGFANFNADEAYLSSHFNILLSDDPLRNIRLILLNRADLAEVAVVTNAYLKNYLKRFPGDADKLLISDKLDQNYAHTILVRDGIQPDINMVNQWLSHLTESGDLNRLKQAYGMVD